jgi:hypothetical protein
MKTTTNRKSTLKALPAGTMVRYARAFVRNIHATGMAEIADRRGIILETYHAGQAGLVCSIAWNDGTTSSALRMNITKA